MYKLYYAPGAASLAIHWMLLELGVPFELVEVDLASKAQRSAAYLALNPSGHVPTMIVDGTPRAECAALLMLLAERHLEAGLAPPISDAGRPDYLQTMFYLANTLQPAFRNWFYPEEAAGAENVDATKGCARARIEEAWNRLDSRLSDTRYLTGQKPGAADFLATMLMRWSRNMPVPATQFANIASYVSRMRALPSLRLVHQREGLTDWIGG